MALEDTLQNLVQGETPETLYSTKFTDEMYANMNPPEATSNSSRMITNVPSIRDQSVKDGQKVTYIQSQPKVAPTTTDPVQQLVNPLDAAFQSIRDFTTQIDEAKTFNDKTRLMIDMRQSAISHIEKAQEEAKAKIEQNLGLPQLRQTFTNAQRIASQNPRYAKDILTLEQHLSAVEARAQSLTAGAMKVNTGLQTYIKTVDKELALQEQMAKQFEIAQQKKLEKEGTNKEMAADVLAGYKPEVLETIERAFPELKGNSVAMAKYVTSHKSKEWQPLLDGTIPEDKYLPTALMGNMAARNMAIATQSKLTGLPEKMVAAEVGYAERLINDPNLLKEDMLRFRIPVAKEDKNAALLGQPKSKDEMIEARKKIIGNVEKVLAARTMDMMSDVSLWSPDQSPLSDPTARSIYDATQAKLGGRKPNVLEFAKEYINEPGLAPDVKSARHEAIVSGYKKNAESLSKGIFHPPVSGGDISDKIRKMEVSTTLDFMQKAGTWVGKNMAGANSILPSTMAYNFHEKVLETEYTGLGKFFDSLVSGANQK